MYKRQEVDYEAADSVFTKRKHVESCKIVYFTKEELARVNKYSKVVASSLIETQSIGLQMCIRDREWIEYNVHSVFTDLKFNKYVLENELFKEYLEDFILISLLYVKSDFWCK